jgi:hypothetical protein
MIYLALLSAFTIAGILLLFDHVCNQFEQERNKWIEERQILLNRIENPKYRPPITPQEKRQNLEEIEQKRQEETALNLVGKILQ